MVAGTRGVLGNWASFRAARIAAAISRTRFRPSSIEAWYTLSPFVRHKGKGPLEILDSVVVGCRPYQRTRVRVAGTRDQRAPTRGTLQYQLSLLGLLTYLRKVGWRDGDKLHYPKVGICGAKLRFVVCCGLGEVRVCRRHRRASGESFVSGLRRKRIQNGEWFW